MTEIKIVITDEGNVDLEFEGEGNELILGAGALLMAVAVRLSIEPIALSNFCGKIAADRMLTNGLAVENPVATTPEEIGLRVILGTFIDEVKV